MELMDDKRQEVIMMTDAQRYLFDMMDIYIWNKHLNEQN